MKRVAFTTLGCKTNQFETADMTQQFEKSGYTVVSFSEPADVYVVNSCTVTSRSDSETRRLLRRARRLNPAARIVATGCYAQVAPDELENMPEVDNVLGNSEKQDIIGLVEAGRSRVSNISAELETGPLRLESFAEHTRAFLQIQNGCNSFCTYCVVPFARGRSRSVPVEEVVAGISGLAANGYQEVVLSGIHLGGYGLDLTPRVSLTELVRHIDDRRLIARLRIGSLEPNEVSDDLIALMAQSKIICPHLHVPLQSGSDTVLSRMGRSYTSSFFRDLVAKFWASIPDSFIGADVIAGFPGESKEEFDDTLRLVEDLPFSDLHVFPYSRRPGTIAADMAGQIDAKIIKERAALLRDVAQAKKSAFLRSHIGKKLKVLVQAFDRKSGLCRALSGNYLQVAFPGNKDLLNTEQAVTVTAVNGTHVMCTPVREPVHL